MSGDRNEKLRVFIVDQRDFLGGCLSSWLDETHGEFLTIVVPDITLAFENEHPLGAAVAILSVPSLATARAWLEKQVALIRGHLANLPVVIIMDEEEEAYRPGLLASLGVQGYIPTSSSLDVALAALRLVIAGGRYYPQSRDSAAQLRVPVNLTVAGDLAVPTNAARLTRREWEVLDLIAKGLPNKIIAYPQFPNKPLNEVEHGRSGGIRGQFGSGYRVDRLPRLFVRTDDESRRGVVQPSRVMRWARWHGEALRS